MTRSRSRLLQFMAAALLVPAVSQAQLGGILKKAKAKVTGDPATAASPPTSTAASAPADCLKCEAKTLAITPDLVSKVLTGLKAELAERDREEQLHANDQVGRLYEARDLVYRCDTLKRADSAYQMSIMLRLQRGDTAAIRQMQALPARLQDAQHVTCENNRAPRGGDQAFFDMLRTVQSKQDAVAAQAAGMSEMQFAAAIEMVSLYVLAPTAYHEETKFPPSAVAAMDAHKAELESLLRREFEMGGSHKQSSEL